MILDWEARTVVFLDNSNQTLNLRLESSLPNVLFFTVGAIDRLCEEDCTDRDRHHRADLMLAEGLAQYLVWKQWRNGC
jgi:hypothetical protein